MGHYDNCRPGYCASCGAAPGNIKNGKCEFCDKRERELRASSAQAAFPDKNHHHWVYKSRRCVLVNHDGEIIAEVSATRHGEWSFNGKTYIDQHSAQRAAEALHGAAKS